MVGRVITCVYCGGAHERPADVKQCWADRQSPETSPGARTAPQQPAGPTGGDADLRPVPSARVRPASRSVVAVRRGPVALGRNVVIAPGGAIPDDWSAVERIVVDGDVLADPADTVTVLRDASIAGRSQVIELVVPFDDPPEQVDDRPAYAVGVEHRFLLDELHHLVWSNALDVRDVDRPRWWAVDAAIAEGATVAGAGDVVLDDGTEVWLDAGPIRFHDPVDGVPVIHAVAVEAGRPRVPLTNGTNAALAPDQLAAVTHRAGTARIIAPAGSGKTRVLTERARHVIAGWRLPPSAVCLVAFNKRAQEEMRERTADLPGLQVRTLNSIALAIVNGTAPFAARSHRCTTIDEPEVRRLLQRFVATPRRRNTDPLAPWIEALGLVRLGLVDPAAAEARYGGDVAGFAEVFPRYQAALDHDRVVDFDAQIDRAITILLTDPAARRAAQAACRVLLVDEFQDLTPAHLLLVRLLAGPAGSVFGVGDDDQTIYGYNGADPAWLIDYSTWFPGAGSHPLEVNYRCPEGVVEVADRLLRHNVRRVPKTIRAASADPHGAPGWSVATGDDEVAATIGAVTSALASGRSPRDIAVLTRVNAVLAPVMVGLIEAGVPVSGGVGAEFAERTAVRAALAWLRLASGRPFAADDITEALRRPSRSLHPRIGEWAGEQRDVDGLVRLADRLTNERDAERVADFAGDVGRLQTLLGRGATTRSVVDSLVDEIGLGGAVATLDDKRHGMNRGSQSDDLLALRQLAGLQPDASSFEGWLRDRLLSKRSSEGVTLATVHRVKGQEWPAVVVHQASADQFPHRLADDDEEERRLFHVAITRASAEVTIVPGGRPSSFVGELTTEPPDPETLRARTRAAHTDPTASRARTKRDRPDHPLLDRRRVMAVVGTVLVDQGQEWTIVDLEPQAALAACGEATRRFPLGSKVETLGRQRGELGPRPGEVEAAAALAFDSLRRFRDRARDGKPAYTVFDDKTLAAISDRLPTDLDELAGVKGVGPAKLEQYGDDVLGVIAEATSRSG